MKRMRFLFRFLFALAALAVVALLTMGASACGSDVNAASDEVRCVYDTSDTGGHRFLKMVQPGEHYKAPTDSESIGIPTSNRFYNMTQTDNRDTLAPELLLGNARDNVAVWTQGVLRFKFNTTGNKPCEWFSKHGRRNTTDGKTLGFNARGRTAQSQAGWFRFLAENDGDTMKQVVKDGSGTFSWQQLVYGNDPLIDRPADADPVDIAYGKRLGRMFTKYLNANLGGDYFCGTTTHFNDDPDVDPNCPPIYFQVIQVDPKDEQLTKAHDALQRIAANLEKQAQQAVLNKKNRQSLIDDAQAQRKVLTAQIENAALTARNDPATQKCLVLAKAGLDCDGHFQTVIVGGQPATK